MLYTVLTTIAPPNSCVKDLAGFHDKYVRNINTSVENMNITEQIIRESIRQSNTRLDLWIHFLQTAKVKYMVELGVYKDSSQGQTPL